MVSRTVKTPSRPERQILAVSELNRQAKRLLEGHFQQVWVSGEISNLAKPQSGHWYFSLKDNKAQIRCAMFKGRNSLLRFKPMEGDAVIARGRISIYEGRGDYQLIVDNLQPAGAGALQMQLEELKSKLQLEGLFDADIKQALPAQPAHVAVVSSASGAALQDILSVFARRAPQILISVVPVTVQGQESAAQLTAAINSLAEQADEFTVPIDAIILARGGGSLEDLWSFNAESLARAIFACDVPVVSAVGHETDFTICDLVADVRAPTPSAAAELLSPDSAGMLADVQQMALRMRRIMEQNLLRSRRELQQTQRLLRHPGRRLEDHSQRCDELFERLQRSIFDVLARSTAEARQSRAGLLAQTPQHDIGLLASRLSASCKRLQAATENTLDKASARLAHDGRMLQAVSPLATLDRGYSIVETAGERRGAIIRAANEVAIGDSIRARLAKGSLTAKVVAVEEESS